MIESWIIVIPSGAYGLAVTNSYGLLSDLVCVHCIDAHHPHSTLTACRGSLIISTLSLPCAYQLYSRS